MFTNCCRGRVMILIIGLFHEGMSNDLNLCRGEKNDDARYCVWKRATLQLLTPKAPAGVGGIGPVAPGRPAPNVTHGTGPRLDVYSTPLLLFFFFAAAVETSVEMSWIHNDIHAYDCEPWHRYSTDSNATSQERKVSKFFWDFSSKSNLIKAADTK